MRIRYGTAMSSFLSVSLLLPYAALPPDCRALPQAPWQTRALHQDGRAALGRGRFCQGLWAGERKFYRKQGAAFGPILSPDPAVVRGHNLPADGQPQARASGPSLGAARLYELIKNGVQFLFRNTHPLVCNRHHQGLLPALQAEVDCAT